MSTEFFNSLLDGMVACHNSDPCSPKKDFRLHDMMGGVMINSPLEEPTR